MNEKTENGETCLRLKQGYTETGPQPVPHGIATGRREIWVLALQPLPTRMLCSCTMHSVCQRPVCQCHVQSISNKKSKHCLQSKHLPTFLILTKQNISVITVHLQDNKSTVTMQFITRVQTCQDDSLPSSIPQKKRVLHFSHILLQYSLTTIHIPFHLIPHLFRVKGRFSKNINMKQNQSYQKPSPNKVGDTSPTALCAVKASPFSLEQKCIYIKLALIKGGYCPCNSSAFTTLRTISTTLLYT